MIKHFLLTNFERLSILIVGLCVLVTALRPLSAMLLGNAAIINVIRDNKETLNSSRHCYCDQFNFAPGVELWSAAYQIRPGQRLASWLGYSFLEMNHLSLAKEFFDEALKDGTNEPNAIVGSLLTNDLSGDFEKVTWLAESRNLANLAVPCQFVRFYQPVFVGPMCKPYNRTRLVESIVVQNYLEQAEESLKRDEMLSALESSRGVQQPDNWNLCLSLIPDAYNKHHSVPWPPSHWGPPLEAIEALEPELNTRCISALLTLPRTSLWTESMRGLMSYLIWRNSDSNVLMDALTGSAGQEWPEPERSEFIVELLIRQHRFQDAEQILRDLIDLYPEDVSYLRDRAWCLEMMATRLPPDASNALLDESYSLFQVYVRSSPDDLFGQSHFAAVASKRRMEILDVGPVDPSNPSLDWRNARLKLSSSLLPNHDFQLLGSGGFVGWEWSNTTFRQRGNHDAASCGPDDYFSLSGFGSARLQVLWSTEKTGSLSPSGFHMWNEADNRFGKLVLQPMSRYLVSVTYRTAKREKPQLAFWLDGRFGDVPLPSTDGEWRRFVWTFETEEELSVFPAIRLWSPGVAWIQSFDLRQLLEEE